LQRDALAAELNAIDQEQAALLLPAAESVQRAGWPATFWGAHDSLEGAHSSDEALTEFYSGVDVTRSWLASHVVLHPDAVDPAVADATPQTQADGPTIGDNDAGFEDSAVAFLAASCGDVVVLKQMLSRKVDPLVEVNSDGYSLLMVAAGHNQLSTVKLLLGMDEDSKSSSGESPNNSDQLAEEKSDHREGGQADGGEAQEQIPSSEGESNAIVVADEGAQDSQPKPQVVGSDQIAATQSQSVSRLANFVTHDAAAGVLHFAAAFGSTKVLQAILDAKADPTAPEQSTVLSAAVQENQGANLDILAQIYSDHSEYFALTCGTHCCHEIDYILVVLQRMWRICY